MANRSPFTTIRTEGGLLPVELLTRLAQQPETLSGTNPDDYHLPPGRRLRDIINRSWTDLQGAWATFETELSRLPSGERATTVTRERWLLPLFAELGYGRLARTAAVSVGGRDYPISHMWGSVPIHLLGADIELDKRTKGVAGAAGASPHSMVQEFLNRSDDHLWALLSNGRHLRILRDNTSLTRAAYVEFDLEDMFNGQVFADFAVLWMLCHQSRFEGERPDLCIEEAWVSESKQQGVRALDTLRAGFEQAITALGRGFLAHPSNAELRDLLRGGALSTENYHREILRLVYRIVFLLVAEDRDLFHPPGTTEAARTLYSRYYSLDRLRERARRHRGGRHGDLWESLKPLFVALDHRGITAAGVPALGSFLWSGGATPNLHRGSLANRDLLEAVRQLAYTQRSGSLYRVDFANLGPEELGSVYESLLELHPRIEADAARFELISAGGNERKTTGSYYTPTSLISCLLDSALDPILDRAIGTADPEDALLSLTVLDPACGSGHFLIAAAQRIANRLAIQRTGETSPPPPEVRRALRQVISRCIYGIDVNPMAVELCKVNLWLEAVDPGRPLNFLDGHLVCGNALLGTTPALLADGVPDDAFKGLTGDDKETVTTLRKLNRLERSGHQSLFSHDLSDLIGPITQAANRVDTLEDENLADVEAKATAWTELIGSDGYRSNVFAANLWCAAFVTRKAAGEPAITEITYQAALSHPDRIPEPVRSLVQACATEYRFLHPHLAFPAVYGTDGSGGFDVVLGNPPWEKVEFSDKEFFAVRAPEVAAAAGARRKRLIKELQADEPELWQEYQAALRHADAESHLLRSSGRFPLCGRGRVNTYAVFAEAMHDALNSGGLLGAIVPTGIATDDSAKAFFQAVARSHTLISLYDFRNNESFFPAIASAQGVRFCLLTIGGVATKSASASFMFRGSSLAELSNPSRIVHLTSADISLFNPNTQTCPLFVSALDLSLARRIYDRAPVLVKEPAGNPWSVEFMQGLFNMASDSVMFRRLAELESEGYQLAGNVFHRGSERFAPLYEAKMIHQFTHRFGDYAMYDLKSEGIGVRALPSVSEETLADPTFLPQPRYWVPAREVEKILEPRWGRSWLLVWRDITAATPDTVRTVIASFVPRVGVGHQLPIILSNLDAELIAGLAATLNSFALDYLARQKVGGTHLTFYIMKQLPILRPEDLASPAAWSRSETAASWTARRVLELTYPSVDMSGLASDLGYNGPPFTWDSVRRRHLRAELDAAFFHLYGFQHDEVDYVMTTFPIVARNDEKAHGEYLTKRLILERYDALSKAIESGDPYETILDPPPADPSVAHTRSRPR